MLYIRAQQLSILSAHAYQRFVQHAIARLQELFPGELGAMDRNELKRRVEAGIAAAGEYGITREKDVQSFLELEFHLGRDVRSAPETGWARAILQDRRREADERLEAIYAELLARHAGP